MLYQQPFILLTGPLHYHFEDSNQASIELTYDEIIEAIDNIGFIIIVSQVFYNYPRNQTMK